MNAALIRKVEDLHFTRLIADRELGVKTRLEAKRYGIGLAETVRRFDGFYEAVARLHKALHDPLAPESAEVLEESEGAFVERLQDIDLWAQIWAFGMSLRLKAEATVPAVQR